MLKFPIYLDHHSTTPLDPQVLEAMLPFLKEEFGNPSSTTHVFGWKAKEMCENAREQAARLIHADAKEIIFTSGATESNNLALKGIYEAYQSKGKHIITQVTEHKAVLDVCRYLELKGARVTYLGVDASGKINLKELESAISPETILISIMHANNEIGTIQPVNEIGEIAKQKGIPFHVDAAQTAGKLPLDVQSMGIDLLSFSAHKMYGPKGAGALYIRSRNPYIKLTPLIHGGGQESGIRSGTLSVPAIVGLGKACEVCQLQMTDDKNQVQGLRDYLQAALTRLLEHVQVHGHAEDRLYNNLNISFSYVEADALMTSVSDKLAVSSGSACTSDNQMEVSHVLKSLGLRGDLVHSAIRFGLGRFNTREEIEYAANYMIDTVKRLRKVSPLKPD